MSNNKTKKKDRKKQQKENQNRIAPDNVNSNLFSAEEMQHVIAKAIVEAEEIKVQKINEQKEKERQELRAAMGYNEHEDKKGIIKKLFLSCNRVKVCKNLLFLPKELINGDTTTFNLLKLFVSGSFSLAKWITLLFPISVVVYIGYQCISNFGLQILSFDNLTLISYGFLSFLLSRLFRMAAIEVDKMEDRNLFFGVFASVTALVSLIISLISLIITTNQGG